MRGLQDRSRALGTHWWNPPFLVPLVEVIGTQWTSPQAIDWTIALHRDAGKMPVHVKKDVPGFVGNRLQHALWREAIALVEHGICDAETVDTVIKASFGRRLAVLGPLENADLVGTDLTLAIHQTVLPAIESRPGAVALSGEAGGRRQARLQVGRRFPHVERGGTERIALESVATSEKGTRAGHSAKQEGGRHERANDFTTHGGDHGPGRDRRSGRAADGSRQCPEPHDQDRHVSPRTGPLAGFGEADGFILEQVRGILAKGLTVGGKHFPVQIISKDSQSSGSRASEVASELILGDKVDLILGVGDARHHQPGRRPGRGQRGALHHHRTVRGSRTSSAARAIRPRASPGPIISSGASRT